MIDNVIASHFFPTGNPIGAKIPFFKETLSVIGVVQQARLYDVHQDGRGQLFVRAEDWNYRTLSFVVRSGREPQSLIPEVRAAARRIDPRIGGVEMRTMDDIVNDSLRQQRISAVLIGGFSLVGLLLAAMGLYGVVSTSVTRRQHEIAVRLALGAEYARVLRVVVAEGAWLVLFGVLIGIPVTYFAGRTISSVLVGVSPSDPVTLSSAGLILAAVTLVSCYLPARRVLRIEPARSLRQE